MQRTITCHCRFLGEVCARVVAKKDGVFTRVGTCQSFRRPKQGRYPAIEDKVLEWMHVQRKESLSMSYENIEMKLWNVAKDLNTQLSEFKISKKWITDFMKWIRLVLQCCKTVLQKLLEKNDEKRLQFLRRVVEDLKKQWGFLLNQIGNADQTPVWFDMPRRITITEKVSRAPGPPPDKR